MKYLSYCLVIFVASCSTLNSGPIGPDPTPMKKADVILIETNKSSDESYTLIKEVFEDEGYAISKNDQNALTIETDYKEYDDLKVWMFSEVVETDSSRVIELSGMVEVPEFQYRVEYGGAKPDTKTKILKKDGGYNPAWTIMMGIALKYPDGKLWYARKTS